jgi:mono/diheme cytochrome c family protein
MKRLVKGLAGLVVVVVLVGASVLAWASSKATARLNATWRTHPVDVPVPFPLSEAEVAQVQAERAATADGGVAPWSPAELEALAQTRAVARGQHLLESRYACFDCHGADLGGGTMMDAPPIGRLFGVNLTSGRGSAVKDYTVADWDRIVRHGVKKDGTSTVMPSMDFLAMSDQELSDLIAYIRSVPPVDREQPRPQFGPIGMVLVAKGDVVITAESVDHQRAHPRLPPSPDADPVDVGRHLAQTCTGCHQRTLTGGPIVGGDPAWPPAAAITAEALAGWTFEDFKRALTQGQRRDGRPLRPPMSFVTRYGAASTDAELRAMWAFLQTVK